MYLNKKFLILIIGLFIATYVLSTFIPGKTNEPPIVGGDKDEHGCIGSAGYSWCEAKKKCLRSWEEKCTIGEDKPVDIDVDKYKRNCPDGYWCDTKKECVLSSDDCVAV
ncbi:MAG: hypothetical protein V1900_03640 [Candidatus Aenigmatarchaeota archaeon]